MKNKKTLFWSVCLLTAALPCFAQLAVFDAGVNSLMTMTRADQAIYYAQSLMEMYNNAQNTYNQFQNMLRAEQRALDNLKGITKVQNFDDFMKWQNRQLYLEREAENRFRNMGVKIGGTTYRMEDVNKIPDALNNNFGDEYWDNFSEDQRKEMWTKLGLSPSNYVYVKTWQAREEAIAQVLMSQSDIINEENQKTFTKWQILNDEYLGDSGDIQDKQILMDIAQILMDSNIHQRSMAYDQARARELEEARRKQAAISQNPPALSESYDAELIPSLTDD